MLEGFPQSKGDPVNRKPRGHTATQGVTCFGTGQNEKPNRIDSGSAARFFYCAKASKKERNAGLDGMEDSIGGRLQGTADQTMLTGSGNIRNNVMKNNHPTVKPLSLMEYLCRLTSTPTGGIVLDPFMGSGTTGMACRKTGRDFIGIELDPHYFEIAEKRIASIKQVELL